MTDNTHPLLNTTSFAHIALHLRPVHVTMLCCLTRGAAVSTAEFNCTVCLGVMVSPVTLLCGHSVCKRCCSQAFQASPKCPSGCGRLLPPLLPEVNTCLETAIQHHLGEEAFQRRVAEVRRRALADL
jgi:hypothetical protein